jgi:signal transduction histidine kinase
MVQRQNQKVAMYSLPSEANHRGAATTSYPEQEEVYVVRENNLRRVVEQMPGILWTTDLELNITFSLGNGLSRLNPMIHPYEGMPLSDFFGDEAIHSPVLDAHYNALGGYAQSFEIEVGGAIFWGVVEPLFNAEWNLIGTVGNATEITNRQNAEADRIRQLTRAHEADKRQALSNLAAGITEHFCRLFNAVSAYTVIMSMGLPPDHPSRRWLDDMEKAAQCASDLIEQISGPHFPNLRLNEAVHVTDLINSQLQTYQAMLSKKIAFQVDLEESNSAVVGDPEEMRRLLVNLLYDASTAIGNNEGVISVRTQVINAPPWPRGAAAADQDADNDLPQGDYLWLQVSDTGHGLDDEARTRIYEPFAGFSGRGIGMGSALSIVTGMHGTMSISSKPGLGTTCHVFLPIMPVREAMPAAPECFF